MYLIVVSLVQQSLIYHLLNGGNGMVCPTSMIVPLAKVIEI